MAEERGNGKTARVGARWAAGVAWAALLTAPAVPAMAQTTDPAAPQTIDPAASQTTDATSQGDEEEIIVTGIRAGIRSSLSTKQQATSIVEVVSAEDIGKLPDVSIAESLARLPGLAGQRVNGRAQVISLRGLSPDFTTTLLNGRQQASSGDNRAVEFDQYPSELLSSVVVYKTPDATISGFGLSGTADLRTVRPLAYGSRVVAANARAEYTTGDQLNDEVDRWGQRFSLSYIDQFANGTLGLAIGYAHLDSPSQNQHFKGYGYGTFPDEDRDEDGNVTRNHVSPDSADDALLLFGQEVFAYSRENVRDAVIGILEWTPNDQLRNTLDLYYSTFSQEETMRGAQWFSASWASETARFTDVQTEDRGGSLFGRSGTIHDTFPQLRNDFNTRDDELFAVGLNSQYDVDETLRLIADLSYSHNERDETYIETYAGHGVGPLTSHTLDTFTFDVPDDGYPTYTSGLNYGDPNQVSLGDRMGWGHDGLLKSPHVEETVQSADFSARWDFDDDGISGFDVGLNYTSREKSKFVDELDLFLNGADRPQVLVDPQHLVSPTSLGYAGLGNVLSVHLPSALGVYYTQVPLADPAHFDKTWDINEDVLTLYARLSIEGGPWRGNFGVQAVRQEQESSGTIIVGNPVEALPITDGEEYWDWLPSVNLSYDLGGGHRIRFAAARVMARPRMDELRANVTPGFNPLGTGGQMPVPGETIHPWSADGGNPHLQPWRADAFDLSYEWYINRTSYFSVAYFYKDLDSYIFRQVTAFDFTGVPIPNTAPDIPDGVIIDNMGTMVLPANGDGGLIRGVEVSGAFDFGALTDALEGLGVIASYSRTTSSLNPVGCEDPNPDNCPEEFPEVRIPGLSGEVYNLTGYFERGGFQARASYRYRSPFKGEVVQLFTNRGFTEILEDEQIDAQIGYTFQDGTALEGLGVLLQVNNLTNSPYRTRLGLDTGGQTTADGTSLLETYEEYGRQILLGVNYRF